MKLPFKLRRRIGEISRELEKSKGGSNPGATLRSDAKSKKEALKRAGVSKDVSHRCEKIANIPEEKSDRRVAKDLGISPSTVGAARNDLEESGDVSKLDTSIDTLGRKQPRKRTHSFGCGGPLVEGF